jgi:hypothetical protein
MTMKPRVVQSERFHGLLVPFTKILLARRPRPHVATHDENSLVAEPDMHVRTHTVKM